MYTYTYIHIHIGVLIHIYIYIYICIYKYIYRFICWYIGFMYNGIYLLLMYNYPPGVRPADATVTVRAMILHI